MSEPKERVRVQAGRGGAPKSAAAALPAVRENAPLPAAASPATVYEVILLAARDPAIDTSKMQALLDMQKDVEDREAKKSFTRSFRAMQRRLPVIDKDGFIDHGEGVTERGNKRMKARFSTYPNLMTVCKPIMDEFGFSLGFVIEPSADGAKIEVVGYLEHDDGHGRTSRFPLGADLTGKKNQQQGFGSAQQYGMRYNAIALLNIVSKAPQDQDNNGYPKRSKAPDNDQDSQAVPVISNDQLTKLLEAIRKSGVPTERVLQKFQIDHVSELPSNLFKIAIEACEHYGQEAAKRREETGSASSAPSDDAFPGDR